MEKKESEAVGDVVPDELGNYNVTMSNTLTRASHALTLVEKRVVMAIVAQVDGWKGSKVHAHLAGAKKMRVTALDYADTYGVNLKNAYQDLSRAADHLFDRQFSIRTKDGRNNAERLIRYRWVSSVTYAHSEGFVELRFTPEVFPHLNALKKQYTTYKLKNAASFKSIYSWRLFEFGQSWLEYCRKEKKIRITLENLQHVLGWPDSYRWDHVKKRAIEPAIKEINKLNYLTVKYEVEKKGRSVHALYFYFE